MSVAAATDVAIQILFHYRGSSNVVRKSTVPLLFIAILKVWLIWLLYIWDDDMMLLAQSVLLTVVIQGPQEGV